MNDKLQRLQRRSFECWRIYGKRKSSRRRAIHKAVYSYNVRLQQRAINALLKNCIDAKETRAFDARLSTESTEARIDVSALANFYRKSILKKVYRAWLKHSRYKRGIRHLNARICDHLSQIYLNRYIQTWKVKCVEKKENVELNKKANDFYCILLQRRTLRLWIDKHNENLLQIEKWNHATRHYCLKLLKKIWLAWIRYCNAKIEKENKIADALCHHENGLLRKSLRKLASNVTRRISKKATLEKASNRYETRLLQRILHSWIDYHRRAMGINQKIEKRRKRVENSLKEEILWQLRLYVWKKKCSRRRNYTATNHYKRKLSEKTISMLKNYSLYRKEKATRLLYLKTAVARISQEVQKVYIGQWRTAMIYRAHERQKIRRVEIHSSERSMKYYFSFWKVYSERYRIKMQRKKMLLDIGHTVLLDKCMSLWIKKYKAAALIHEKENHAALIYEKKLLMRFFNYWKRYIDEKRREKVEIDEAKNFYRKNLLREGLRKALRISLCKSESRYESRLEAVKENYFQDFEIMRKFFGKWWMLVASADKKQPKSSNTRSREKNGAFEIPYARNSSRFVIPEYMTRETSSFHDNCGFPQRGHFSYLPSESSSSEMDKSTNSSSGRYDPIEREVFT